MCELLEYGYPDRFSPKSLFGCYSSFYKKLGRLRDINVQIDLFREICNRNNIPFREFDYFLSCKKSLAEDEICSHFKQSDSDLPGNIKIELEVPVLDRIRKELVIDKIESILHKHKEIFVFEQLHWLRRQLKQIVYLNKMILFSTPVMEKGLADCIHSLEVKLGRWHDLIVLRGYIREYCITSDYQSDKEWIDSVTNTVRVEEVQMLKSVEEVNPE